MSVDEARRSALFQAAVQALGEDPAVTMFELLPPPETDLATTADLASLEERLGARIDGVEQRLGARIDGLDARIDGVVQSIDHLAETLRTEMALQREELLGAFRGELVAAISGQTRGIVVALTVAVITGVVGIGGLAVTLSQLL
jgi:phage-related protein